MNRIVLIGLVLMVSTLVKAQSGGVTVPKAKTVTALVFSTEDEASFNEKIKKCSELDNKITQQHLDPEKLSPADHTLYNSAEYHDYQLERGYWNIEGTGCSWYCAGGPQSVTASSVLKTQGKNTYDAQHAHDLNYNTAWVEGVPGYGIGESLLYKFTPESPRITKIIIINGYIKSEKAFTENSRAKKINVYLNNKLFAVLPLVDGRCAQSFEFDPIGNYRDATVIPTNPWALKFEIADVYKGTKYDDTVITEIYFDGIDDH